MALCPGSPPEFPKHFDSEFFRARRVAYDTGNHAGDPPVVGAEYRFEIGRALGKFHRLDSFTACVHDTLTPAATGL
jgi:hypothetical protein